MDLAHSGPIWGTCAAGRAFGADGRIAFMIMPSGKQPAPGQLAREFSAHVRAVMLRDGVTALALAEASGLSRNYLGKRLRDEMPFTLNDVEVISKALKLKIPKL